MTIKSRNVWEKMKSLKNGTIAEIKKSFDYGNFNFFQFLEIKKYLTSSRKIGSQTNLKDFIQVNVQHMKEYEL